MKFTILGGEGFIGRRLREECLLRGYEVIVPERNAKPLDGEDLGHLIYCIGLTSDFRWRPFETVEAHVQVMADWLKFGTFQSFLYLSSTRIYQESNGYGAASEDMQLSVSMSADSLYNLSKMLGEALCLCDNRHTVRIARLANVFGPDMSEATFLGAVMADARRYGAVTIRETPLSSKDYISIDDAVRLLISISLGGKHRTYNLASGIETAHAEIAQKIREISGAIIDFLPNAEQRQFPKVDISRLCTEFDFVPRPLLDSLPGLYFQAGEKRAGDNYGGE